jgi:biotin transport system substrate-specific component
MSMTSSFRALSLVSLFAALMGVLGMIPKIDLAFGVPVTLQTLGVMLAGCLIGARLGSLAMALFLLAVAMGLPLLAGGRGGLGVFFAPSVGYLVAWPLGAFVTGWLMERLPRATPRQNACSAAVASALGGMFVVHLCGVAGLVAVAKLSWAQAALGTLLFVPGDLIKCAICAFIVPTVVRGLPDWQAGQGLR